MVLPGHTLYVCGDTNTVYTCRPYLDSPNQREGRLLNRRGLIIGKRKSEDVVGGDRGDRLFYWAGGVKAWFLGQLGSRVGGVKEGCLIGCEEI